MSSPGGFPSQSACFPPSLPPQAFSFSLGAAISWPFITPAPPSFSWSLILQERLFWSAGFPRCWIRSWEVTPGFTVCFYENYFSIVRQKDQKLIPVYYSRINRQACQDGIMAVFTGENLCIPFRDPDGGQVWDDLCRFLKEKNPSIVI